MTAPACSWARLRFSELASKGRANRSGCHALCQFARSDAHGWPTLLSLSRRLVFSIKCENNKRLEKGKGKHERTTETQDNNPFHESDHQDNRGSRYRTRAPSRHGLQCRRT